MMTNMIRKSTLKVVGANGQISLGKHLAGRQVQVEEYEDDSVRILPGTFVPDNERWLHEPEVKNSLERAIAWAEKNPPTDCSELLEKMESSLR